jgi:hypothetical protein
MNRLLFLPEWVAPVGTRVWVIALGGRVQFHQHLQRLGMQETHRPLELLHQLAQGLLLGNAHFGELQVQEVAVQDRLAELSVSRPAIAGQSDL